MVQTVKTYRCAICLEVYPTRAEAEKCEARGLPKFSWAVGDIVTARYGFGWFDGDTRWVINPKVDPKSRIPEHGNCFGPCCTWGFYYVVTEMDTDPDDRHRSRYHLFTGAMSGKSGYDQGYTYDEGHHLLKLVPRPDRPRSVILDSRKFLGRKADRLL